MLRLIRFKITHKRMSALYKMYINSIINLLKKLFVILLFYRKTENAMFSHIHDLIYTSLIHN